MAALVNALDKYTPSQIGENGHEEYGWSINIREKIIQFYFQLNRVSNMASLERELRTILRTLASTKSIISDAERKELFITLYKIIGHTRDIIDGKGEYALTYMMIYVWYDFYPDLAKHALFSCVQPEISTDRNTFKKEHPYGSWKDIKYFCQYCKDRGWPENHEMFTYAFELILGQLALDILAFQEGRFDDMTLVCKWIARESSKFGWIFDALAKIYFGSYLKTAKTPEKTFKAISKAKMDFRKLITKINKALDTTQIKQCDRKWATIDFDKVTSITLNKQKSAFLNTKKNGEKRCNTEDRIECAENYTNYFKRQISEGKEINGKHVGMEHFTKQAFALIDQKTIIRQSDSQMEYSSALNLEIDMLNSQWRNNSSNNTALGNFIAMVDTSSSMFMSDNAGYVAIALGCRVAEKSILGKRIMTFSTRPDWCNLEDCNGFVDQVEMIKNTQWGMNTNFHAALDLILDACVEKKLPADDVANLVLVIFSDMQMDQASTNNNNDTGKLYEIMEKKFRDAGVRAVNTPYKPPHILFWNLRSTSGFPVLSNQKNVSMMSGYNPALLNNFCDDGMDIFHSITPWSLFTQVLNNQRYLRMENEAICWLVLHSTPAIF
jgi:hypothetical protein